MSTCKTAFYHLRNIGKITNCLCQDDAPSKLDFCNALLCGLLQSVLHRLQYVQNCATRVVSRISEHITPVLRRLHWLPIKQRITHKILLLTYKALNGTAPKYIGDLQPYTLTRQLRSSSKNLLVIPKSNLDLKFYRDRCFQVASPRLWNTLPDNIRPIQSLDVFKN